MEADIVFLIPALQLYEKLMLTVQTQVIINKQEIQKKQNFKQAQQAIIWHNAEQIKPKFMSILL